jgi:predicted kinase
MLVGLVGSGKSTCAKKLKDTYGSDKTLIIESDAYREIFYGKPEIQGDNNKLFEIIHNDILANLSNGLNVVFDATNVSRKHRVALLQKLGNNVVKECIVLATSYGRCVENNQSRSRVVPKEVIDRMWKSFQFPTPTEGWDLIDIEYNYDETVYDLDEYLSFADHFDQMNPYHSMTLGIHSRKVAEYLSMNNVDKWVELAGLLHDCGKPMVQSFEEKEDKVIARYFNHENVSAYEAMFYLDTKVTRMVDLINAITLINYHMRMYDVKTDKAKEKLKSIVGEDLFYFLEMLHDADKRAH